MNYFIDGSSKGLAIGCGIVEVCPNGFMNTHSHHSLHPSSDSTVAELFAVDKTIDLIFHNNDVQNTVYVDRGDVQSIFQHKVESNQVIFFREVNPDYVKYVEHIRNKIKEVYRMKKSLKIFKQREESYEFQVYQNVAHAESRSYLRIYDDIYLDDATPLKGDDKLGINHSLSKSPANLLQTDFTQESTDDLVIEEMVTVAEDMLAATEEVEPVVETPMIFNTLVTIEWDGKRPFFMVDLLNEEGNPTRQLVTTKHLVNVFYHTCNQLKREMNADVTVHFTSPSYDMLLNLENSLTYHNCPADIRKKGEWILEAISNGTIVVN